MRILYVLALILLVPVAQSADRLVRLHELTGGSVELLLQEGYDVASASAAEGYVDILIDERDIHTLEGRASDIQLLPPEWARLLPENLDNAGYFYSPEESWAFWCGLASAHSDLVDTPVAIGQSFESRDIYMIRMTSSAGPPSKPAILFTALTHAREPIGLSALIDFATWLSDEYGSSFEATFILDNAQIFFVPIVNPDGYAENMPSGGMHRKNMNFSVPVASSGIDLNRNYSYMWGYDNIGSSPDPYSSTYRGHEAFSEPESQVMRDFHNSIDPVGIFNYHSYGEYLLHPWGYTSANCPDYATFQSWGAQITAECGYVYGSCSYCLGYPANGDANDWAYGDTGHDFCMGFTPEVGDDGFWGGQNDSSIIVSDCAETRFMNKTFCLLLLESVGIGFQNESVTGGQLEITSVSPNPASMSLNISLDIPAGPVDIGIYDICGRRIDTIGTSGVSPGSGLFTWSVPSGIPDGVYMVRATSGSTVSLARFTLLRH